MAEKECLDFKTQKLLDGALNAPNRVVGWGQRLHALEQNAYGTSEKNLLMDDSVTNDRSKIGQAKMPGKKVVNVYTNVSPTIELKAQRRPRRSNRLS